MSSTNFFGMNERISMKSGELLTYVDPLARVELPKFRLAPNFPVAFDPIIHKGGSNTVYYAGQAFVVHGSGFRDRKCQRARNLPRKR
jgi:hypothetical protein